MIEEAAEPAARSTKAGTVVPATGTLVSAQGAVGAERSTKAGTVVPATARSFSSRSSAVPAAQRRPGP